MKFFNFVAIACLFFAALSASATTYQGIYKNSSLDATAAKLDVTLHPDHTASVSLAAPTAACTLTFGKSAVARDVGDTRLYDLPVINSCESPSSFRYALIIETAADGKRGLTLRGTNGKMTWVFFRAN